MMRSFICHLLFCTHIPITISLAAYSHQGVSFPTSLILHCSTYVLFQTILLVILSLPFYAYFLQILASKAVLKHFDHKQNTVLFYSMIKNKETNFQILFTCIYFQRYQVLLDKAFSFLFILISKIETKISQNFPRMLSFTFHLEAFANDKSSQNLLYKNRLSESDTLEQLCIIQPFSPHLCFIFLALTHFGSKTIKCSRNVKREHSV